MRRRSFLSTSAAGLALGAAPPADAAPRPELPKRVFGKTGEKLTLVGQAGGRLQMCGDEEAKAVVRRAFDLGVNYFDQARLYWNGHSEEIYGEVLQPHRKQIFLTSKSAQRTRQGAEADLEKSLRALRTDYLDLWQIHQVGSLEEVDQIFAKGGAIEAFEAAKRAGKCRFIGFTGHRDPEVHLAMLKRYDRYDTILMPLNPADPTYLSFEKQVLPIAVERGMGIQAMKATANAGLLRQVGIQDCLGYVLSLPVHCLAVGCTSVGQIEDDVRIARSFQPMSAERKAQVVKLAARVAGPKLETWKKDTSEKAGAYRYLDGVPA